MENSPIYIGCSGWSIRWEFASEFPADGTHLTRYAAKIKAVEINSSFKSTHRLSTYQRWAESVGADFRFAVKLPSAITHQQLLRDSGELLTEFLDTVTGLGEKLGVLLTQLPPRLRFNQTEAEKFFRIFRRLYSGALVIEPRNETWFDADAEKLLSEFGVSRAIVDPAPIPAMSAKLSSNNVHYYRLHGSPITYYSNYPTSYLQSLAAELAISSREVETWCIFDNTAQGHALSNALQLQEMVRPENIPLPVDLRAHNSSK